MSYIRSFIALDLPEKTKKQIGLFQEKLRKQPYPIRWENPANFHINLLFLGDIREVALNKISSALTADVNKRRFELSPTYLDYLYKRHGDSIIYISVEGELKRLKELRDQVCRIVKKKTSYDTPIRFLPHITVGRIKPYIGQQEKKDILSGIINFQPKRLSPFVVQNVKLMQTNFLEDTTHRYMTIMKFPLG